MHLVLGILGLHLLVPPVRPLVRPPDAARTAPTPRWAFVSAYVTVPTEREMRRIKVVTRVFALCDGRELPSTVFAAADSALRAAVRRRTRATFTITHHALEVRTTRDDAEAARRRGLSDGRFARTLEAGAGPVPCCCAGDEAPRQA
jgi:hypothetical protein